MLCSNLRLTFAFVKYFFRTIVFYNRESSQITYK
jgi:hypothetical protein